MIPTTTHNSTPSKSVPKKGPKANNNPERGSKSGGGVKMDLKQFSKKGPTQFMCYECGDVFTTDLLRTDHLKAEHFKYWAEKVCDPTVSACFGRTCAFDHEKTNPDGEIWGANFYTPEQLASGAAMPFGLCRYERPDLSPPSRCLREECSYNHLWGRVRAVLKMKSRRRSAAVSSDAPDGPVEAIMDQIELVEDGVFLTPPRMARSESICMAPRKDIAPRFLFGNDAVEIDPAFPDPYDALEAGELIHVAELVFGSD
jgi:hypothetical protein